MKYYILVDSSYFIFYRVFALYRWWKFSHNDEECINLHENVEFIEKYKELFIKKFKEIPKKLKLPKDADITFIIARDCPRKHIWRSYIYKDYKGTRGDHSENKNVNPDPFFKITFEEKLFENTDFHQLAILQHDFMEGDDCIAISSWCIEKNMKNKDYHIYIIANDADFYQLCDDNISLRTLAFKDPRNSKNSFMDSHKDLLYKIMIGDKSDNIPSVFDKNIKSQAKMMVEDPEKLIDALVDIDNEFTQQYMLNSCLIDFTRIPQGFIDDLTKALEERFFPKNPQLSIEYIFELSKKLGDDIGNQITQYLIKHFMNSHSIIENKKVIDVKTDKSAYITKPIIDHRFNGSIHDKVNTIIHENTDGNTDGNTDNNTDDNIDNNTDDNIDGNTDDNIDGNTDDNDNINITLKI